MGLKYGSATVGRYFFWTNATILLFLDLCTEQINCKLHQLFAIVMLALIFSMSTAVPSIPCGNIAILLTPSDF